MHFLVLIVCKPSTAFRDLRTSIIPSNKYCNLKINAIHTCTCVQQEPFSNKDKRGRKNVVWLILLCFYSKTK